MTKSKKKLKKKLIWLMKTTGDGAISVGGENDSRPLKPHTQQDFQYVDIIIIYMPKRSRHVNEQTVT